MFFASNRDTVGILWFNYALQLWEKAKV